MKKGREIAVDGSWRGGFAGEAGLKVGVGRDHAGGSTRQATSLCVTRRGELDRYLCSADRLQFWRSSSFYYSTAYWYFAQGCWGTFEPCHWLPGRLSRPHNAVKLESPQSSQCRPKVP